MSKFNIGDKVRVKDGNAEGLEGIVFGFNRAGLALVRATNSGGGWAFTWYTGSEGQWVPERLTLIEAGADRTHLEGKEIDGKDVKVGDRILVTYDEDEWGVITTTEGVVSEIMTTPSGSLVLKTAKTYTSSIYISNRTMVKSLTLLKAAAPEPSAEEKLLEKFKKAEYNQVIQHGLKVARKFTLHGDGAWYVLDGGLVKTLRSEELVDKHFKGIPEEDITFFPRKSA